MQKERLSRLAEFLKTVPQKRFNLYTWGEPGFEKNECRTTACACGWATVLFKDEGFILDSPYGHKWCEPSYDGCYCWCAVELFFGLDEKQAPYLFDPFMYPVGSSRDPLAVSERIKDFIQKGGEIDVD